MRITVGRTLIVLGLVAAAAAVVWVLMPGRIPVEVASVKKDRFVASVDEDGKTRIRERYVVAAPLAGRLGRVRFKVGDPIRVDDVCRNDHAVSRTASRSAQPSGGGREAWRGRSRPGARQGWRRAGGGAKRSGQE